MQFDEEIYHKVIVSGTRLVFSWVRQEQTVDVERVFYIVDVDARAGANIIPWFTLAYSQSRTRHNLFWYWFPFSYWSFNGFAGTF